MSTVNIKGKHDESANGSQGLGKTVRTKINIKRIYTRAPLLSVRSGMIFYIRPQKLNKYPEATGNESVCIKMYNKVSVLNGKEAAQKRAQISVSAQPFCPRYKQDRNEFLYSYIILLLLLFT